MPEIAPTIGRHVDFFLGDCDAWSAFADHDDKVTPYAAVIAGVDGEPGAWILNLAVFDDEGEHHAVRGVPLIEPFAGDNRFLGFHAMWMPYQRGQAAKTDQEKTRADAGIAECKAMIRQLVEDADTLRARLNSLERDAKAG